MNLRPLGYEPNELPDCSTSRLESDYSIDFSVGNGFIVGGHLEPVGLTRLMQEAKRRDKRDSAKTDPPVA